MIENAVYGAVISVLTVRCPTNWTTPQPELRTICEPERTGRNFIQFGAIQAEFHEVDAYNF
jgi:hypothetical protein